jgi:Spy/CpxP family protein refolding chaperone
MKVPNTVLTSLYLLAFLLFATPIFAAEHQHTDASVKEPPAQQTQRPWLGVTIQEVTEKVARQMGIAEHTGVLVADVVNGSPADEAGVDLGDVIIRLNGHKVIDPTDFITRIQEAGVGATVALEVNRAGTKEEINVILKAMPPEAMFGSGRMGYGTGQGMGMGMGMMVPGEADCPMHAQGMDGKCPMGKDCPMGQACPGKTGMACPQCPKGDQCPDYGRKGGMGMMHRHHGKGMMMGGKMGMSDAPMYGKIMMAIKGMDLKPEQKAKADAIRSEYRKKAVKSAADAKVAHMELHELLAADTVNMDKVKAKVNQLSKNRAELMMMRIKSLEDLKKVLSPEQKKTLKDALTMDSGDMEDMDGEAAPEGAE